MKLNIHPLLPCVLILLLLNGCAAVVVGGGAAAAGVAFDRRTTGTVIEDEAIELKARQALMANTELNEQTHINFTSYNTYVLVSGEAPTETYKQQVIDIVRSLPKVTHVYDEIRIAAPSAMLSRSSDSVITTKLKTKLLATENVKGIHIKIVTESGVVYLMGLVSPEEANLATDVARQTGGVQKVVKLFLFPEQ